MYDHSRKATFSSSQAYRLMAGGKKAQTYIKEVRHENKLGRSIRNEFDAKQTSWGTLLEGHVFKRKLNSDYKNVASESRLFHPTIAHYSGVPDFLRSYKSITADTVADCKCPFNPGKFCDKMEALKDYERFKEEYPEDFWQLISNLFLLRSHDMEIKYIESINYVPYLRDIADIRMLSDGNKAMRWLDYHTDNMLPWIPDNCEHYKDINVVTFEAMQRDVDAWEACIIDAVAQLTGAPTTLETPGVKVYTEVLPKRKTSFSDALKGMK